MNLQLSWNLEQKSCLKKEMEKILSCRCALFNFLRKWFQFRCDNFFNSGTWMSQKGQGTDWLLAGIGEEEEGKKWNNINQISLESLFRNLLKKNYQPFASQQFAWIRSEMHNCNTSNRDRLHIPLCRTAAGQRAFTFRDQRLWNSFPDEFQFITNLDVFKVKIKQHFLRVFLEN